MSGFAIIFAGPTLTAEDRARQGGLCFWPPVARGDVLTALEDGPALIGIVDGFFGDRPAVLHKEILDAMAQGIRVYGAASMGALRAAELDSFGMIGIGAIYRRYAAGECLSDADVAVLHGPEAMGYPALSVPLVDVQATLASLEQRRHMTAHEAQRTLAEAREIHYPNRTWQSIAACVATDADGATQMAHLMLSAHVEAKRLDAIALLSRVSADLRAGVEPMRSGFAPPLTPSYRRIRKQVAERIGAGPASTA